MRKRWQNLIESRVVRAIRHRWRKFKDGIRYALGLGPIGVSTTCHYCERDIDVEVE